MEATTSSALLVFVGEMGDKTQLLALLLTVRYQRPWTILFGVFVATVLNHAFASWAGVFMSRFFDHRDLLMILAATFFGFALWILVPDKEGELKASSQRGVLMTTIIAFFLAEMGDKTQFATIALGARYADITAVTVGSTLGMVGSNALAIFLGDRFLAKVPMKWVRISAALLFALFGLLIVVSLRV